MTFKEIQDLLKFVSKSDLSEVRIKDSDFEITVRNKNYTKGSSAPTLVSSHPVSMAPSVMHNPEPQAGTKTPDIQAPPAAESESDFIEIKSPMIGTFYRSGSPDKPPFVNVGDVINPGDVVCIIEAMKLFNEIESEISGKIVKILVENASPVEYDQPLFLIDPSGS